MMFTPAQRHLHTFAVVLAICTLLLVIAGASVTSKQAGLSVPDWPLSYGQVMPEMKDGVFYEHGHRMIASFVGFLTIIMAVWVWRVDHRKWMKGLGLAALGLVILQGVLGGMTVMFLLPPQVSIAHACLAQIFFSVTIALALFTSPAWLERAETLEDSGFPPLRTLAVIMPVLVLLQVGLGAGYRHRVMGIMPHILGAIVIGTLLLIFAVFVLAQFPTHRGLRRSGWTLGSITFVQMLLGLVAYLARVSTIGAAKPPAMTVILTVAHVAGGALTVAATVALSLHLLRYVRSRGSEVQHGSLPAVSR